ncbi:MAG: hypothetical protein LBV19_08675 [Streptococcaceae bacterium]|jgi:hypothetical protein|nr:hypothetical protein [Streptococcaceae bacterium]
MKLTKITAAAVAALTLGGAAASTGTAFADGVTLDTATQGDLGQFLATTKDPTTLDALKDIAAQANPAGGLALYRMYNPGNGEHFYTVSSFEAASLLLAGWSYEGTLGTTAASGSSVLRLYNANAGVHYYTASEYEARQLVAKGWSDEGVAFIDSGSVPVFAAYNANNSQHNFTTIPFEQNALIAAGWHNAGGMNAVAFHLEAQGTSFGAKDASGLTGDSITSNGDLLAPAEEAAPNSPAGTPIHGNSGY